jgi:hypothetical protein
MNWGTNKHGQTINEGDILTIYNGNEKFCIVVQYCNIYNRWVDENYYFSAIKTASGIFLSSLPTTSENKS